MTEHRFFTGDVAEVSTFAFHEFRPRAPHLEQDVHKPRLICAAELVKASVISFELTTVSDLGCGDGGLLSLVKDHVPQAWGYDFCPANAVGWLERGVDAQLADVFGCDRSSIRLGEVVVLTEVLEHLTDPREVLRWLFEAPEPIFIVASSPNGETPKHHCEEHAWGWDAVGYISLFESAGWTVRHQDTIRAKGFQLVIAGRSHS